MFVRQSKGGIEYNQEFACICISMRECCACVDRATEEDYDKELEGQTGNVREFYFSFFLR